jgi:hypothetical protein
VEADVAEADVAETDVVPIDPIVPVAPAEAEPEASSAPVEPAERVEPVAAPPEPAPAEVGASSGVDDSQAHAAAWLPSRGTDWIGSALTVVATIWAVWALFRREYDGSNAFTPPWANNVAAVVLTASLLLPLLCFRYGIGAAAVSAGTALGYLAYQGFPSSNWFWYEKESGNPFPMYMVFIAVILIGAWLAFRAGNRAGADPIRHRFSFWLQLAGSVAAAVAVLFFGDLLHDWTGYYTPRVWAVYFAGTVVMIVLSAFRNRQTAISLALVSAACALTFLGFVIHQDFWRARAWNVVIASGIVAATAVWRSRRPRVV